MPYMLVGFAQTQTQTHAYISYTYTFSVHFVVCHFSPPFSDTLQIHPTSLEATTLIYVMKNSRCHLVLWTYYKRYNEICREHRIQMIYSQNFTIEKKALTHTYIKTSENNSKIQKYACEQRMTACSSCTWNERKKIRLNQKARKQYEMKLHFVVFLIFHAIFRYVNDHLNLSAQI